MTSVRGCSHTCPRCSSLAGLEHIQEMCRDSLCWEAGLGEGARGQGQQAGALLSALCSTLWSQTPEGHDWGCPASPIRPAMLPRLTVGWTGPTGSGRHPWVATASSSLTEQRRWCWAEAPRQPLTSWAKEAGPAPDGSCPQGKSCALWLCTHSQGVGCQAPCAGTPASDGCPTCPLVLLTRLQATQTVHRRGSRSRRGQALRGAGVDAPTPASPSPPQEPESDVGVLGSETGAPTVRQSCSPMRSCHGPVFSLCSNITTSSCFRQVIIPLLRRRGKPQEASYWTSPGAWVGGFAARGLAPFPVAVYWVLATTRHQANMVTGPRGGEDLRT